MNGDRLLPIPAGFEALSPRGSFIAENGPFYRGKPKIGEPATFAFLPSDKHCNGLGFVHGGMLSTFLDSAMAQATVDDYGYALVTLALNVNFQHVVFKKRWVVAEVLLRRESSDHVKASAILRSRGIKCVSASGVFRLLLSRPVDPPH